MEKSYDLAVIGGGGGGYPAAFQIAKTGRSVIMVDEKGNLGGNCLYEGCIPSKAVREAALAWREAGRSSFFGLNVSPKEADWQSITSYKDGVQERRYAQHKAEIEEEPNLTFIRGRGKLIDANHVEITDWDADDTFRVKASYILIATGSTATELPIDGFEMTWNHHDLYSFQDTKDALPSSMVILGGGYIGVEAAYQLSDLGIKVTVVEMLPTILSGMDRDLSATIEANLKKQVDLHTGIRVTGIAEVEKGRYVVKGVREEDDKELEWAAGAVLAAAGRRPFIPSDLGLDLVGIEHGAHGILTDTRMHTNVPHIYAAGDVNGQSMLFHSAVRMSEIVAKDILAGPFMDDFFDPVEIPATVFSSPEGLSVGLTTEHAEQRGIRVDEIVRHMGKEARAQIVGELEGFIKLVIARRTGRIVGIHGVGADAASLSAVAHMAVRLGLTVDQLGRMTFPHPTQFEIFDRLARSV
ncbi:MAG: dihydrolipoyl dehydrogenase [Actinobacteria bacterium]|nr:dihydrolipoyl dehydrogenase [Actinomycetota bacterium]MCL6095204.1 dihydrolipoyl dehydrogenase [Actinomycetota bacterium]